MKLYDVKLNRCMNMNRSLILFLVCAVASMGEMAAQNQEPLAYWGKEDAYLMKQSSHMFDIVDEALAAFPPVPGASLDRKLALYNLDAMLHEVKYDNSEPFCAFVDKRMQRVIEDMKAPLKKGMKVYKIYNHGFVARTKKACVAFDVVRGYCKGQHLLSNDQVDAIVENCDVLFLTHNHGDHVDRYVADRFIEAGKPVIAPDEILANVEGVTHYRSETDVLDRDVTLADGDVLKVKIFPGMQDQMMCNVYVVTTPDQYVVAHTGDQYNREDLEWLVNVKDVVPKIDALMINCWTYNLKDVIEGFDPRYVITGHENEMGHTIDHREAFWLTFQKMQPINHDYVVMAWGECFLIK